MLNKQLPFSVLMSVYIHEKPEFLEASLDSIINQTVLPQEIVLVKDGPLTKELDEVIRKFSAGTVTPVVLVPLDKNVGLGQALKIGLENCSCELVARMDSDDLCAPNRFEIQFQFLERNPAIAVVGTSIEDFHDQPGDLKILRVLPETGESLLKYAKYRSPVNHATIMFRKQAVIDSGSYNSDIKLFEDFSLFIRMLKHNYQFYNLKSVLYYVRVGSGVDAIKRRSGMHYIKSEIKFLQYAHRIGHLSLVELLISYSLKIPSRLLPPKVLYHFYNRFLREKAHD